MAKTTEQISKALKLKAQPKSNALSIKVGIKKLSLPFESRILASEKYMFVHIPPAAMIFKYEGGELVEVSNAEEARAAQVSFRSSKKKAGARSKPKAELPAELQAALSKIPAGYKLGFGPDGSPRMVKTRVRKK